ncbi:hypothetical protein [Nocardiopsis lambiniae]|uniref:Uncharacterized protein n=1 Tax=Nocardiopsis lambiniae TaxID=3075539 RepID=A0ABU2MFI3_9ACTN|nr:hypothetical protein [Nocardiopsis sp. DSM 44743]MDT0331332.1 hypothetical protein [Nocardiopsis sp. DSM 44743]
MTQANRISARTVLLAAGTAGFVALGTGIAGAEALASPVAEIAPIVERTLVEGVAPTMNTAFPGGVGPVAGSALTELQETSHDPAKPAPDLSAVLPAGERDIVTPFGDLTHPGGALGDAVASTQDATGLDGNPHDTVGHDLGAAVEKRATGAGTEFETTAQSAGGMVEDAAAETLPHTVIAVQELRDEVGVPSVSELPRPAEIAGQLDASRLPDLGEGVDLSDPTALTSENALAVTEVLDVAPTLPTAAGTVPQSAGTPEVPNMWDFAHAFGLETPKAIQDVVESNPVTDDNYVSLGEEEVLGMIGNRNLDEDLTAVSLREHQSAPGAADVPGLSDLTNALLTGASDLGSADMVGLDGPLSDAELPQVGTGLPTVDGKLPQVADTSSLPSIAEGPDMSTVEDLVAGLSRGPGLLEDLDTSDLVSIDGGTAEAPATPEGMVSHPTFMDLPGSEALPLVS